MNPPGKGEEFRDDYRKALPKETVQRLATISTGRSAWSVLQEALVLAALIAIALHWWAPLSVIPCAILIGTRQHALFVLAHDAAHYRLFGQRWLNDATGRACATALGLSMCTYRAVHRLHREMVRLGILEGAEVMNFRTTLGKVFAARRPLAAA